MVKASYFVLDLWRSSYSSMNHYGQITDKTYNKKKDEDSIETTIWDTWRSLGCQTTPLEYWSKQKQPVEPWWAEKQKCKVLGQIILWIVFKSGPSKSLNHDPLVCNLRRKQSSQPWFGLTSKQEDCFMTSMFYPFRLKHMTISLKLSQN